MTLEEAVRKRLKEVTNNLDKGKGTWPKKDYIKDSIWDSWIGQQIALAGSLRDAGLDI